MKKIALFLSVVLMLGPIAGCGSSSAPASSTAPASSSAPTSSAAPAAPSFPANKPITLIVPWAAGGGSDVGARILQPYLEASLKTTVTVINPVGASGWIGWEQLLSGSADGYTVSMVNFPALFGGYMDKASGRTKNLNDFHFVANHVSDDMILVLNIDEKRFTTLEEFLEYAKSNEITFGTTGVGTQGNMLMEMINADRGLSLTQVPFGGWNDIKTALLGGHIDVGVGSVGEVSAGHKNGELKGVCIFATEKSSFVPDIPTWKEVVGTELLMASQRGFAVKAGTPKEITDILEKAFEEAITNPEQVAKMAELGLKVDYIGGADYTAHLKNFEKTVEGLAGLMGWQ